jgi:O-antigen/teichoic acid export membrane protein
VFQLGGVITNAVWPEISFAFGSDDVKMARALHRRTFQVVMWLVVPAAILIAVAGRILLHAWTRGSVPYMPALLYLLLATAVVEATWTASAVVMLGSGKHHRIAGAYLVGAGVSIALAIASMPRFGVEGAAASLLVVAVAMAPYVMRKSLVLTGDSFPEFSAVVSRPPVLPLLRGKRVVAEGARQ